MESMGRAKGAKTGEKQKSGKSFKWKGHCYLETTLSYFDGKPV